MTNADSIFPIALPRRSRRGTWLLVTLASLVLLGVFPILDIAQASRQRPAPAPTTTAGEPQRNIDRPATITLGALIEAQRLEREQRRATAAVDRQVAELPPGDAWQAQLGAFGSAEAAERQRARLFAAGVTVVVRQEGALHRLHSVPALRAETEGLCARALAGGIDCFVRRVADAT